MRLESFICGRSLNLSSIGFKWLPFSMLSGAFDTILDFSSAFTQTLLDAALSTFPAKNCRFEVEFRVCTVGLDIFGDRSLDTNPVIIKVDFDDAIGHDGLAADVLVDLDGTSKVAFVVDILSGEY
jgi:hypothetical protein